MIQLSNISKRFGERVLFDNVTLTMGKKERLGLVGRNGLGKSTLFKIILGETGYDTGDISMPRGYRLGHLNQHIEFTKDTVIEECCQVLPEDEIYDFYKAEKLLFGLGFTQEDMYSDPNTFSGGYQLRIQLTKCLLQQPDLLLLDEPTNYLDIVSLIWLRQFLRTFPGEVLMITHDRSFMDSVVTHTAGINRGQVRKVEGGTEKYYDQIQMDEEIYEKTKSNHDKKIKDLEKFVEKNRANAATASLAQSKMKLIKKMGTMDDLGDIDTMGFRFNYKPTPAKTVLTVKDLSFGFEEGKDLFKTLNFEVKIDDRVAIVGKNGNGKTTLLNVIAGKLQAKTGEMQFHPETQIAYFEQTNKKNLQVQNNVIDEIWSADPLLSLTQVRAICGAMMFPGDTAEKKIGVLSGGELSRVLLGQVIARPSNLLLLDEPTNHLDMESIAVLADEIKDFRGATLMVTHDEDLLHKLATKIIYFKNGRTDLFLGNYEEFLEKIGWD
ncbi:MAG: ATP-binding cassette domain-containing protein [Bdellovibrionaceae bacterium]|nr:ATP-binding cassette domain-containing protein [Pseudobdellovibrionaceae bacterium]